MLGYFRDEKVAFVQGPQEFYNRDSFQHHADDELSTRILYQTVHGDGYHAARP